MTNEYHCPTCDGMRNCSVHGHKSTSWDWSDDYGNSVNGGTEHSLLQCGGCNTVFYHASNWNSEAVDMSHDKDGHSHGTYIREITTYPKPKSRSKPHWLESAQLDALLLEILNETYSAYDNESYTLAAIGLRTALDRATEVLEINPNLSFTDKVSELLRRGLIGTVERDVLDIVTEGGNAAAHRAWSPSLEHVHSLMSALDIFLQRAFILGHRVKMVKEEIPPDARKKKAAKKASGAANGEAA